MQTLRQDLTYGLRMLARQPGFAIIAIITLAAGIGFNTAIFSIVNSIILRPLPYTAPEQLLQIWEDNRRGSFPTNVVSPANFLDWRAEAKSFESLSAYNIWLPTLANDGETTQIAGAVVTTNFFNTLGITPQLGRTFLPEEEVRDKSRVVILSHGLWQGRFGGDPAIIGRKVLINELDYTVIGVLRPDYRHPEPYWDQKAEMWRPLVLAAGQNRGSHYLRTIGRLKTGVSVEAARAEMMTIARRLEQAYPDTNREWGATLVPLHRQITGSVQTVLWILQGAVVFVLLIACVNVANLLLARVAAREREMAIRAALGAGKWRIIRLLLVESLLLATAGGILGLLLALWGVDLLMSLAPRDIPRLDEIALDRRVLAFTFLLSLATTTIFGLLPALQAARVELQTALKDTARTVSRGQVLRGSLVVAEVALALVLLIGSGLLLRSLWRLQHVDLGFEAENLLTLRIDLPPSKTKQEGLVANIYQQIIARIEALPGVQAAGVTSSLPLGGLNNTSGGFTIEGAPPAEGRNTPEAGMRAVSPNYFRAMSIPLRRGRLFDARDRTDSAQVVIINEALARRYFPNQDPLGRKLKRPSSDDKPAEIIGIVGDFKHEGLQLEASPELYQPHAQNSWSIVTMAVRTTMAPAGARAMIESAVREVESSAAISKSATMREILNEGISRPRFNLLLLGIFSLVAVVLAAIGIYGVISYTVAQSTREIGIRLALGAQVNDVLRLVVGRGLFLTGIGLGIGVAGALGLTRLLESLLFGVQPHDPLTFLSVTILLALVAAGACYLPARRATRVDPMVALRYE